MPFSAPTHVEQQGRKHYDQAYHQYRHWGKERAVYASVRWRKLRGQVLREQPECADPYGWHQADGVMVASQQVDHMIPLRVDLGQAYERKHLQGLCARCHTKKTHEDGRRYPVGRGEA